MTAVRGRVRADSSASIPVFNAPYAPLDVRSLSEALKEENLRVTETRVSSILEPLPTATRRRVIDKVTRQLRREDLQHREVAAALAGEGMTYDGRAAADAIKHADFAGHWLAGLHAANATDLPIQTAASTHLHHLLEAATAGRISMPSIGIGSNLDAEWEYRDGIAGFIQNTDTSFLVQHRWAAAMSGAELGDVEAWSIPYRQVAFEFVIAGRRVIALFDESMAIPSLHVGCVQEGANLVTVFAEVKELERWVLLEICFRHETRGWVAVENENHPQPIKRLQYYAVWFTALLARNVQAMMVVLDAKVVETEVIRAPGKLNAAREKRGAPPVYDYHVLNLARRYRASPVPEEFLDPNAERRRSPRLHFRRSHWRQLATHRVKVPWMLVGDPDLGFIDKDYRL